MARIDDVGAPALTGGGRPDRRTLAVVGLTVAVALALVAATALLAVTTVLSPSCGEDLAWIGLACAAGIASAAAAAGLVRSVVGWRRRCAPRHHLWMTRCLLLAMVTSGSLAIVAMTWLPDGSCQAASAMWRA